MPTSRLDATACSLLPQIWLADVVAIIPAPLAALFVVQDEGDRNPRAVWPLAIVTSLAKTYTISPIISQSKNVSHPQSLWEAGLPLPRAACCSEQSNVRLEAKLAMLPHTPNGQNCLFNPVCQIVRFPTAGGLNPNRKLERTIGAPQWGIMQVPLASFTTIHFCRRMGV